MGKLLGNKHRMCRRIGERLCNNDRCPVTRRHSPPGTHGVKGYGKLTEYGTQLREKQKAKYMYGIMEKQFRNYFEKALHQTGNTTDNFLRALELRLDNAVFRSGFAKTRAAARQLVSHGWVLVNGQRVTIPSYQLVQDDEISLSKKAKKSALAESTQKNSITPPSWLAVDTAELTSKVVSLPLTDDYPKNLNMTLIVEFYSR